MKNKVVIFLGRLSLKVFITAAAEDFNPTQKQLGSNSTGEFSTFLKFEKLKGNQSFYLVQQKVCLGESDRVRGFLRFFNVFRHPLSIFPELYATIASSDYRIIMRRTNNNNRDQVILETYIHDLCKQYGKVEMQVNRDYMSGFLSP